MNPLSRIPVLRNFFANKSDRLSQRKRRNGEFARTMLIVIPLTVLIWFYAENAQKHEDTFSTILVVSIGDPTLTARVTDQPDTAIGITVFGPRGQIESLRAEIESHSVKGRLRVPLRTSDATVGEKNINLAATLAEDPLFASSSVQIEKTSPSQLHVSVEPVSTVKATVAMPKQLPPSLSNTTLLNVTFDPPRVLVRGPAMVVNAKFGRGDVTSDVDLSNVVPPAGTGRQTVDVPLVIEDPSLDYDVTQVKMSFELGSNTIVWNIPSVVIATQRPVGDEGRYRVEMKRNVIQNVHIRGPADLIAQYQGDTPQAALKAILNVSRDDVGKTDLTRQVEFSSHDPRITILDDPPTLTFSVIDLNP